MAGSAVQPCGTTEFTGPAQGVLCAQMGVVQGIKKHRPKPIRDRLADKTTERALRIGTRCVNQQPSHRVIARPAVDPLPERRRGVARVEA